MISSKVGTVNRPSNAQFWGRNSGRRSRARRVLISARVKSSVNQPVMVSPSMTLVRRRALRMLGDIGGAPDLVLVPRDEHPVVGHYQIRLDIVGALFDRQPVRLDRVLRTLAAGAAMSNDEDVGQGAPAYRDDAPQFSAQAPGPRLRCYGTSGCEWRSPGVTAEGL